jgi:transposase
VAMDMWDPYINSVRANLAEADKKIVFDKFHLLTELLGGYSLVIG